jgi:hypothetical protein
MPIILRIALELAKIIGLNLKTNVTGGMAKCHGYRGRREREVETYLTKPIRSTYWDSQSLLASE